MKVIVVGNDVECGEFTASVPASIDIIRMTYDQLSATIMADACFLLSLNAEPDIEINAALPVFINAVVKTRCDLNLPPNISRINAWPGFLRNDLWEVVTTEAEITASVLEGLGKKACCLKDVPGMLSPRILSMIINEAYHALGEGVSSKAEIDIAMKLGTNYPYGPFEWSQKIGLINIYDLLQQLSQDDRRCLPAPALREEIEQLSELVTAKNQ